MSDAIPRVLTGGVGSGLTGGGGGLTSNLWKGLLGYRYGQYGRGLGLVSTVGAARHKGSVDVGTAGIPVVYGTRLVQGFPVFYGGNSRWLWVCFVWCEGTVYEVGTAYLNSVIQTDDRFNVGGRDQFTTTTKDGTDTQSAVTTIGDQSSLDYGWDDAHRLLGVAYTMALLLYDEGVYGGGSVPNVTSHITGIEVTDWRTGGDLPTYTVSLHNPIVCLYDYLTNSRYGMGISTADIDTTSFTEAANYCDDSVTIDGTVYNERYTCDAILLPDDGPMANIQTILDTCRGRST